jgi:hypothetical protein
VEIKLAIQNPPRVPNPWRVELVAIQQSFRKKKPAHLFEIRGKLFDFKRKSKT